MNITGSSGRLHKTVLSKDMQPYVKGNEKEIRHFILLISYLVLWIVRKKSNVISLINIISLPNTRGKLAGSLIWMLYF